jgi:hypothetical protein
MSDMDLVKVGLGLIVVVLLTMVMILFILATQIYAIWKRMNDQEDEVDPATQKHRFVPEQNNSMSEPEVCGICGNSFGNIIHH